MLTLLRMLKRLMMLADGDELLVVVVVGAACLPFFCCGYECEAVDL
jgi:hypothetical protein